MPTRTRTQKYLLALSLIALTPFFSACGLAGHISPPVSLDVTPGQANPGEQQGTIPTDKQRSPVGLSGSPEQAVDRFAETYINWTYKTLPEVQARLAASAVGEARTVEEQAEAQATRDTPLQRAHIYNTGTVLASSQAIGGGAGEWVVVTREQTGGDEEYAAIPASLHVTLATVQKVDGAWAVSSWRPGL